MAAPAAVVKGMRIHPRFTLRAGAIILTLVCAYLGAWEATKRYGIVTEADRSPMPFLVVTADTYGIPCANGDVIWIDAEPQYSLWLFGLRFRLASAAPANVMSIARFLRGNDAVGLARWA
jgi:hypothetical protein